jgi:hypothetical protein
MIVADMTFKSAHNWNKYNSLTKAEVRRTSMEYLRGLWGRFFEISIGIALYKEAGFLTK